MTTPLNSCGLNSHDLPEGICPDDYASRPEEWLPAMPAAVRVGRNENSIRAAARRGEIRWRMEAGRMIVAMPDVRAWSGTARSVRRSVKDRRPAWFSHLPGPTAQADAATLARQIVGLRNEYEAALKTFPEAAMGYLVEAEMLLDERSRLLRQPGAVLDRALVTVGPARQESVA